MKNQELSAAAPTTVPSQESDPMSMDYSMESPSHESRQDHSASHVSETMSPQNREDIGTFGINSKYDVEKNISHHLIRKINQFSISDQTASDELEEDEELIKCYRLKIKMLHKAQLMTDDIEEITKNNRLITQLKISIKDLSIQHETKMDIEESHNKKTNKKIDIPNFQLVDDPSNNKSENYPSYENAESFVTTFETILLANDVDVGKEWKKYLPNAFMFNKNEKHLRWYTNFINPISQHASWEEIKEKLIDRFGNSANKATNIEKYLDLRQQKNENIRDYVDRYLDTYRRLPITKNASDAIEAMKFIKSLLPKAREEVTNSLKKNKKTDVESYLPDNLEQLFKYLEKNIGDIQEALYISVIIPTAKSSYNESNTTQKKYSNVEGYDRNMNNKRGFHNNSNSNQENQKRFKDNKNLCNYCNKASFSYDHLKICVSYLTSDKYKQFLLRSAESKENGRNKVQIFYCDPNPNIKTDNNFKYSDLYNRLDEDLEDMFHLITDKIKVLNINKVTLTHNNLNSNDDTKISCYLIDEYGNKERDDLSPYSPFITINNEKLVSMLDTGATISLINKAYDFEDKTIFDHIIPAQGTLSGVDKNSSFMRIGKTNPLEVSYKGRPIFKHKFEIVEMATTTIPILIGRDLIPKLGIYIENIAYNFDEQEEIIYNDTVDDTMYKPNITKACSEDEYEIFMERMKPYLEANNNINIHELCPRDEAVVYLKTPPNQTAFTRPYPIAYALLPVVREQIQKWLDDKTIEPAKPSSFNSPLTLVPKPNGPDGNKKWRVCLDTRKINTLLEDVSNVNTPLIEDIFYSLREAKFMSVFDVSGAFHRLKINKSDRHKLSFTFENKTYCYRGAPFGLKSLSGIFQNLMEMIFADMKEFVCIYIDDLVCFSNDLESHERHCKLVLEALTKNKLPINQEKTYFARNAVYLLGYCISPQGKSIDARRLVNIDSWEKPKTAKAMMKFCGWASYMRSHLPNASELTAPLDHLRYSTKKVLEWTPQMHEHYQSIIDIIKENIVLSHPDLNHEFSLAVDASNYAVGACLFQEFTDETGKKTIKYIGFASKALNPSQRSYSVTKKELFALTTGLTKFYKFLYGSRPFKCYTDHRSLQYLFTTKHISMMMLRYMEIILSFPNMNVIWIPGVENIMSDKLSRLFPTPADNIPFEKDERALFPQIFKKNQKNIKSIVHKKRKSLSNKQIDNEHKTNEIEFMETNGINIERLPNFAQYFCSTDMTHDTNNHVRIKTWTINTVHNELDKSMVENETDNDFQINFIQNMDESFIVPLEADRKDILQRAHSFGHGGGESLSGRIKYSTHYAKR
ncbi:hypothetical protein INT47_006691 [Mucor saturninus]|uniref:RNA-directed DNA polymerase n=1 Tax=Mucor saturninus TaxID=64648 RepID=A0A8H7UTQ0_9FUNG|nr:hypothetical protein INT47_006691 [Mucor saturninus]